MLTDVNIQSIYSTDKHNVAEDFYVPILKESIFYDRVAGYFNSQALSYFSKGLEGLYFNNGHYRLLISNQISEDDYRMLVEGYKNREVYKNYVKKKLFDIDNLGNLEKKRIANLAYLIEIGFVDVKIGFTQQGIFHSKYGIMGDEKNNNIYFSGSLNETQAAFKKNYESITVLKSWDNEDTSLTIENQKEEFQILWDNKNTDDMIIVKEVNEILNSELLRYSEGRFVVESDIFQSNALILYIESGKVKLKNNLVDNPINEKNKSIKKIRKRYLEKEVLWNFIDNLNYNDLEEITRLLKRYGERESTTVVISSSIYDFIESSKFEINEIYKRGIALKNRDEMFLNSFGTFKEIISEEVDRQLRPIQEWVSYYMTTMKRVANFSVPGSGKTAMLYGTFAYLSSESINEVDRIIMIGPKNAFKSWKDEFKKVFGDKRELNVLDIHSSEFRKEMLSKNVNQYNLLLFNYESLNSFSDELERLIDSRTMIIFDEVHKVKGINTQRAPLAIQIAQKAKYRYVLTGTPIPNSYADVWNFLHILYKNEFKTYFNFSQYDLQNANETVSDEVNTKLFPFFWRVTKEELNVPAPNDDNLIKTKLTDSEQNVVNLLWKKYRCEPFKLYIRLIQFSSNPSLLKKNIGKNMFVDIDNELNFEYIEEMNDSPDYSVEEYNLLDKVQESSKFKSCINKANSLINEKKTIIIWCIFVDTIIQVSNKLSEKGHKVATIYGATSAEDREKIITQFQEGYYDVLVTNPHTLAESVSLHMVCHDALYLESSFNLTHMLQSRDRIHRLGLSQNQYTAYHYFLSEGQIGQRDLIDKKIYRRLKEKEVTMLTAIEGSTLSVEYSLDEKEEILQMMNEETKYNG